MTEGQLVALGVMRRGDTLVGRGTWDHVAASDGTVYGQIDGRTARLLHREGLCVLHLPTADDPPDAAAWCEITDAGRRAYRNFFMRAVPDAG